MARRLLFDITFPGEPVSKQRPRATRGGRFYTPPQTRKAEAHLQRQMRLFCGEPTPTPELAVRLEFYCGTRRRKDLDNLVKLVWDAANTILWQDDSQVGELYVKLERGVSAPRTLLQVFGPETEVERGSLAA